jgi:LmbE family N-acetylglucosaminyl deacetylase
MSARQLHLMVVGAHAFDAEVMAGHLIAKYTRAGHKATIVHLTMGEKGHKILAPEEYAAQKKEEAKAAAKVLGADVRFLPYKDAELPADDDVKYALCDIIRETKPNIIITHWKGSIHKDHINTHLIVEDARFYAALPAIQRALPAHGAWCLFYAENWEDPEGFEIDTYVDITDVFGQWVEACHQYALGRGEVSSFRYMDYYQALATMRGCLAGYSRAAALMRPKGAHVRKGQALPGYDLE